MLKTTLSKSNVFLDTVITELRFKDNFKIADKKYKLMDKLTKLFGEYNTELLEKNEINAHDPKRGIAIGVLVNRISITHERFSAEPGYDFNFDEYREIISRAIKDCVDVLEIDVFNRVGVRSMWRCNFESLDAVTDFMKEKYLKFDNFNLLGEHPKNCQLILTNGEGRHRYNLTVSAMSQFVVTAGADLKAENTKYDFLLMDWDYYTQDPTSTAGLAAFIKDAYDSYSDRVLPFLSR